MLIGHPIPRSHGQAIGCLWKIIAGMTSADATAWRRAGDKPSLEPMMAQVSGVHLSLSFNLSVEELMRVQLICSIVGHIWHAV